jgi:dihydroflavonol-4-reductase
VAEAIFITGGTGMVGANLVRRLVEKQGAGGGTGAEIRLLTRGRTHPFLEDLPVQYVRGDLRDVELLCEGMRGCSQVYHVAGLVSYRRADRAALREVNVTGTRNVLAAARRAGVRRVVHTSSTAAVGYSTRADMVLDEHTPFDPHFGRDPYMWTKHLAEVEVWAAVREGADVVMVNPSTIYGAGDLNRNTSAVFPTLRSGRMFAAPPGGTSVVAVDDVVSGLLLAMQRGESGRRYILSSERLLYHDMFNRIAALLGGPPVTRTFPAWLRGPLAAAAGGISVVAPGAPLSSHVIRFSFGYRYFSAARAISELGWTPAVSFDDAVRAAQTFHDSGV